MAYTEANTDAMRMTQAMAESIFQSPCAVTSYRAWNSSRLFCFNYSDLPCLLLQGMLYFFYLTALLQLKLVSITC